MADAFYVSLPPGLLLGAACLFFAEARQRESGGRRTAAVRHSWSDYLQLAHDAVLRERHAGHGRDDVALRHHDLPCRADICFKALDLAASLRPTLEEVNLAFGAITVVTGIAGTLAGIWLGDKLRGRFPGSYFLVSGMGMLVATPLFLLVITTPFTPEWKLYFWPLIFCIEFCLFLSTGPANTALANVTRPGIRSSAFAINIFLIHLLGDAISPSLVGTISDRSGGKMNVGFAAVSAAIAVSGLLWLAGSRYLEHDTLAAMTDGGAAA